MNLPTKTDILSLQKEGLSMRTISTQLRLSQSVLLKILKDKELNGRSVSQIKRGRHIRNRFLGKDKLNLTTIAKQDAKLFAALLYWCEGSKYPSETRYCFTNSDPKMHLVNIALIRKAFKLDETKFRVWLQIHDNQNQTEVVDFWSEMLNIPPM